MEEQLLEAFETAKKAAGAAADGGGSPEVDRCIGALRQLRKIHVNKEVLVNTQVGKRLRCLTKHPDENIHSVASDLLKLWKDVVIEETSKNGRKNSTSQDKSPMKVDVKSKRVEVTKIETLVKSGTVKGVTNSKSECVKVEKLNSVNMESSCDATDPPKLTTMLKSYNPWRDKLREVLADAFAQVSKETSDSDREEVQNICNEVDACDPIRVAVTVESIMFDRLGPSTGANRAKYRSIVFNLRDTKNPDFRRRILLGEVKPEEIVDMAPGDMASDDRKITNQQIKQKALFECERGQQPKATTDQFKCSRCGQRKCTYYQMQTRSADEPMTTYVTCLNCDNHWKFC